MRAWPWRTRSASATGSNDIPMFEVAGRSFAMGQAPDEVKSRATDVVAETAETGGGVAAAIERAFGIRTE